MQIEQATRCLKVKIPTTRNALKRAFYRRSREEHPDVSKHPDAHDRFLEIQQAYKILSTGAGVFDDFEGGPDSPAKCHDGTPLSELGNGLGPMVNGTPCEACDGKGYSKYSTDENREDCPDCRMVMFGWVGIEYRCRRCGGDGKFKNKKGRAVGECYTCRGTGWFRPKNRGLDNSCKTCHGRMWVSNPKKWFFRKCDRCKGCGEMQIYNPVLPKGLLADLSGKVGGQDG